MNVSSKYLPDHKKPTDKTSSPKLGKVEEIIPSTGRKDIPKDISQSQPLYKNILCKNITASRSF